MPRKGATTALHGINLIPWTNPNANFRQSSRPLPYTPVASASTMWVEFAHSDINFCPAVTLRRRANMNAAQIGKHNAISRSCWRVLLTVSLAFGVLVRADANTVYVIDQINIGLHESSRFDSAIAVMIGSGTPLEILERDGNVAKVKTPEGKEGWVDLNYVKASAPVATQLRNATATNEAVAPATQLRTRSETRLVLMSGLLAVQAEANGATVPHRNPLIRNSQALPFPRDQWKSVRIDGVDPVPCSPRSAATELVTTTSGGANTRSARWPC